MHAFTLYKQDELRAVPRSLLNELREEYPSLTASWEFLRCTDEHCRTRVWDLAGFARPQTLHNSRWVASAEAFIHPDDMSPSNTREFIAGLGCDVTSDMIFALDYPDATLVAPWSILQGGLQFGVHAWLVAPMDLQWFLYSHHGEFLELIRMRYDSIAQLATVRRFRVPHTSAVVEKPQFLIRYTDGDLWLSGTQGRADRESLDALFRFLSERTGKVVEDLEFPPDV